MAVTREELIHISELAKLEIPEETFDKLEKDMSNIVDMVGELSGLDLSEADDKFSLGDGNYNVLREDEVKESLKRDDAVRNAPDKEAGCYVVPRIVE